MKMTIECDIGKVVRFNRDQGWQIFRKYPRYIKRAIKNRIGIYDPLDFETMLNEFLKWAQMDDYKIIREFPADATLEIHLDDLIKQFLVKKAYYHFLFEDQHLIENYVRDILTHYSIPPDLSEEITLFVREKLEAKKKIAAVKKNFKEKSKFKTYFYAMIANLVKDYQEKHHVLKKIEPNKINDMDILESKDSSPPDESEMNEMKTRVEKLPDAEKLALKLYFYDGITNFSALGRALGASRYKAKKVFNRARSNVLSGNLKNRRNNRQNKGGGRKQ